MKTAVFVLRGISPLQFGRFHETAKLEKEKMDDYEIRTWKQKAHQDGTGNVFIPAIMIKNCLCAAAKYLGMQVYGKGKKTYGNIFKAGTLITEDGYIGKTIDDAQCLCVFGRAQGGKRPDEPRVKKYFPTFDLGWEAKFTIQILDETITRDVFMSHLEEAGKFIGLGVFRPIQGGHYGRFEVVKLDWK